jgi:glutamate synthase (NADPH) small chain
MVNPRGFIEISRIEGGYRPIDERVQDYDEIELMLPDKERQLQASRCMDCGIPFCHWACPVKNIMPEWQSKIAEGDWRGAYEILQATNNFPEFTGRVCPAPCEVSCVLSINDEPVTIRENELSVIERAFQEGYVHANPPEARTGKRVAVIGSGPAGLACADILNQKGHTVVLFEREDAVGGYLRYGIPDFKLDKKVIDRRVNLLIEEGLIIKTGMEIGKDMTVSELQKEFDAVCLTIGARYPRDIMVAGRELNGIHFAVDFLRQQNKTVHGDLLLDSEQISAKDKHVVVIGGGDTGADCVGTSNRHGAKSITQLEILPQPPEDRPDHQPWPLWATVYKTSTSHKEGSERKFAVSTKEFQGIDDQVNKLKCVEVEWTQENGAWSMQEIAGSEFELDADLVLLAMGFIHPEIDGLVDDVGVGLTNRQNVRINSEYMTTVDGVFAAGDASRGASLVVWAIFEGRKAAESIDKYLIGDS